ncbi:hypothetical protein SM11_pC1180 (plasmid) [Sinorhizobium meliloti SM11]|uniref:Uncharacterized protein n=1 Tax=Sinorhizobium meliloti (strain SM11) TaxID=707241 RepID=F7XFC8_SINMM|nr:hypothetical protein SM11_pC1180 [Sinorhizobium meliloti SM11]
MPPGISKLKQLEDENARLKTIVADLTLDLEMLQDVIRRSFKACSEAGGGEGYVPGLDDLDPACLRRTRLERSTYHYTSRYSSTGFAAVIVSEIRMPPLLRRSMHWPISSAPAEASCLVKAEISCCMCPNDRDASNNEGNKVAAQR